MYSHARLADDHGPEWRHVRPRLVGPRGRRAHKGNSSDSPERELHELGRVSGLELDELVLSPRSLMRAPFLRGLHLESLGNCPQLGWWRGS